jgi:Domain of unknown function (DUF5658)
MVRTWFASLLIIFVVAVPGFAADERATAASDPNTVPAVNPAPPTRGAFLPGLYVSAAALQVYDGLSTMTGLKQGAVEANPLLTGIAGKSIALWAVKGGVTTVSIFAAVRLWRQHRRAEAIAMMVAVNGVAVAVAARNASVTRAVR